MAEYFSMANGDERFMSDIDKYVQNRIEAKLRQDTRYFTDTVNALEILPYLESVIRTPATREHISCLYNNNGNTYAVRKLLREMQRFQNFGMYFLKALVGTGHRNLAEELIYGFQLDANNTHSGACFIRELLYTSPPPYNPPPSDEPFTDQQEKLTHFNSLHHNPTSTPSINNSITGTLSTIHSDEILLSNPSISSATTLPNCPPPYGHPEQNLNFSSPSSSEMECDGTSTTINNGLILEDDHTITRHPIPVENEVALSDLHPSEYCVSGDLRDMTIPKVLSSRVMSSDIERLNAIVPSPSTGLSTFGESTGSTRYEEEERVIEDPSNSMKNYSARKIGKDKKCLHEAADESSSSSEVRNEYLWGVSVAVIAMMSVLMFLIKHK